MRHLTIIIGSLLLLPTTIFGVDFKIDVSVFALKKFNQSDEYMLIGMATVVVLFIGFSIIHNWYNHKKLKRAQANYKKKKEESRLQQLDVSAGALQTIQDLAKHTKKSAADLLSSNHYFESAVNSLQKKAANSPLLTQIPGLRDELGYVFFNRRVPFITSKMLQPGQKVRVGVTVKGKGHSYVATVLNSTEEELWVKPPTVKGKTVNLLKFKQLNFSVFRKNDGEYRFSCTLRTQIQTPVHAVVTNHSTSIKKLQTREYDRYVLQFQRKFFFIVSKAGGKTNEKGYAGVSCMGQVQDISLGGLRIFIKELPPKVQVGTSVVFFLKEAAIKKELQAKIVRLSMQENTQSIHLQFVGLTELNRLHLQKFIEAKKPIKVPSY